MLKGLDKDGNFIYASKSDKNTECYCQECHERLVLKKGLIKRPYFSHKANTDCNYGKDSDNKSEWHIRMQDYFPEEDQEVRFVDEETGEYHIADVFDEKTNTVFEFQKSHIEIEEFLKRSIFHIKNGRRIVWVFDESMENPKENDLGRLRNEKGRQMFPYNVCYFKWLRTPRKCLNYGPQIKFGYNYTNYSICVYTGVEGGDYVHRIIDNEYDYEYITISSQVLKMDKGIDVDDFFRDEIYWLSQSKWKGYVTYTKRWVNLPVVVVNNRSKNG